MRAVAVLLAVLLGLAAALVTDLRMSHLRHLAPDLLPGWTAAIDEDATLLRGSAAPPDLAGAPVTLDWSLAGIGPAGATWRLRAEGPGRRLTGQLLLSPDGVARLEGGTGRLDLATLDLPPGTPKPGGTLELSALSLALDLDDGRPLAMAGLGRWPGASLDGHDLGTGEVRLSSAAGGWRADVTVEGPAVEVTGEARGRFTARLAALDLVVRDAGAMPDAWRRPLDLLASPDADGWHVTQRIDLPAGLPACAGIC